MVLKMAKKKVTTEQFIRTWKKSKSVKDVADKLGLSQNYASVLASKLRHEGKDLPNMPRGNKEDKKRLMTRTSDAEYDIWTKAAERAANQLGLPNLTIGPWSRMVLNQAARALGFEIPEHTE